MEVKSNLFFQEVTRIDLDKYYNDLNEKLITSTNNSEVPAWEVNLNKN